MNHEDREKRRCNGPAGRTDVWRKRGRERSRMNMIIRTIGRLHDARVVYVASYPFFVGNHQNIIDNIELLSPAINRRFSMIRKDPTSSASPLGANVRIDEHLVLDALGAVSSESENCRKIAAESDILFLSVATAPIALFGDVYGIL